MVKGRQLACLAGLDTLDGHDPVKTTEVIGPTHPQCMTIYRAMPFGEAQSLQLMRLIRLLLTYFI